MDININAQLGSTLEAELYGIIGTGVQSVRVNERNEIIFVMADGRIINAGEVKTVVPTASADVSGTVKIGAGLKMQGGVMSVDTANTVEKDNTKPVTSGAVHMEIGNIEVLLRAI